jgi:gamma-glutamylcyclotransferase (GGCT)/AIG2-like uncharacterized protein YtfP
MKKGDLLFVYGTLMSGERMSLADMAGMSVQFISNDSIDGEMYNIGRFPGVKIPDGIGGTAEGGIVYGEVYRLLTPGLVARLDAYEGYPDLYDRRQVITGKGRTVWVYTFNPAVTEYELIKTGDWRTRVGQQMAA